MINFPRIDQCSRSLHALRYASRVSIARPIRQLKRYDVESVHLLRLNSDYNVMLHVWKRQSRSRDCVWT